MARSANIANWPLAWKAPLLGAALMIGVAAMVSQVVLSRLEADQESNLGLLTSAYLDGLSAAVLQPVIRADVWETFDALDRARSHYSGVNTRFVVVELPNDRVLAASDPVRFPVDSVVPPAIKQRFPPTDGLVIDSANGRALLARSLRTEGVSVGRILSEIDIAVLLQVRREVLFTLILVNAGLTAAFAAAGYFALKHMLQPFGVLTSYVERIREGRVEPIPEKKRRGVSSEFSQLFDRFNAMAQALGERETLASRLAEQEKYAVLGKLTSGMAHEVNNPLGGLFNALDTLRHHGGDPTVRESTLDLLQRGLTHIRNVVRATLVIYRQKRSSRPIKGADIDDLRLLVEAGAARKDVRLDWDNEVRGGLPVAASSLRQATLNLLLNAIAATPPGGVVSLRAIVGTAGLAIEISDQGPGLPQALASYLVTVADEAAPPCEGLGLWVVRRLVADEHGSIRVSRENDDKTIIRVSWPFRDECASRNEQGVSVVGSQP